MYRSWTCPPVLHSYTFEVSLWTPDRHPSHLWHWKDEDMMVVVLKWRKLTWWATPPRLIIPSSTHILRQSQMLYESSKVATFLNIFLCWHLIQSLYLDLFLSEKIPLRSFTGAKLISERVIGAHLLRGRDPEVWGVFACWESEWRWSEQPDGAVLTRRNTSSVFPHGKTRGPEDTDTSNTTE